SSWPFFVFESYQLATKLDSLGRRSEAERIARRALQKDLKGDDFGYAIGLTLLLGRTVDAKEFPSIAITELKGLISRYPRNRDLAKALFMSYLGEQPADVRIAFWRWYADSTQLPDMRPGGYVQLAEALIDANRDEEAS